MNGCVSSSNNNLACMYLITGLQIFIQKLSETCNIIHIGNINDFSSIYTFGLTS